MPSSPSRHPSCPKTSPQPNPKLFPSTPPAQKPACNPTRLSQLSSLNASPQPAHNQPKPSPKPKGNPQNPTPEQRQGGARARPADKFPNDDRGLRSGAATAQKRGVSTRARPLGDINTAVGVGGSEAGQLAPMGAERQGPAPQQQGER